MESHSTTMDALVLREAHEGVVTLTLNRPLQFNALSEAMLDALQRALDDVAADDSVRCVVLAAAGKAFCAGHDLREMRGTPQLAYYQALFARCSVVMQAIQALPVPVIVRVHGIATAAACARFGLECVIYMGEVDCQRQALNVFRMKLLGAEVVPVETGSSTLKDAMNGALRDWVAHVDDTFYVIGTVAGPHPYPAMVRDFQSVIGNETREQIMKAEGRLPDSLVACIGGGSNAMGLFHPFLDDEGIRIIGVEAAGDGIDTGRHAASLAAGSPGVLHGNRTYLLQDGDGQIIEPHSISAGLDYPGIGPEHAWLHDMGRVDYVSVTDAEALDAFQLCSKLEGIIPALEPSHALAHVLKIAPDLPSDHIIVMNMCGRGDKDVFSVAAALGVSL